MDRLRSMEVFVKVAESGSFAAAAAALDLSPVMVGKYLQQLEAHLSVSLIQRTTRRQRLTEAGRWFLADCRKVLEQVREAEAVADRMALQPRGRLRVTASVTLGQAVIAPAVADFARLHAQVRVELNLTDNMVDLLDDGYDAAIRIGKPALSDHLVARPLRPYRMAICASPDYLARAGTPRVPADLARHQCLNHLLWNNTVAWHLRDDAMPAHERMAAGPFASNSGEALREAAVRGCGVVMQPEALLAADIAAGRLVSIMADWVPEPRPVHLLYARDRQPLAKLTRFVDYMLDVLGPA